MRSVFLKLMFACVIFGFHVNQSLAQGWNFRQKGNASSMSACNKARGDAQLCIEFLCQRSGNFDFIIHLIEGGGLSDRGILKIGGGSVPISVSDLTGRSEKYGVNGDKSAIIGLIRNSKDNGILILEGFGVTNGFDRISLSRAATSAEKFSKSCGISSATSQTPAQNAHRPSNQNCANASRSINEAAVGRKGSHDKWRQSSPGPLLAGSSRGPICKYFSEQHFW